MWLASQAFLANSVFVLGRNLGPVIFMHSCGADELTGALFISGASIIFVSPLYGHLSKGVRAAQVNLNLTIFCMLLLLLLSAPLLLARYPDAWLPDDTQTANLRDHLVFAAKRARAPAAYLMFLTQDLLTLLLMMQSASLSQATLDAYSAKRLIGLVQLGCSCGAVFTGVLVGPLAEAVGTEPLILVQVAVLFLSLVPNAFIARAEERYVRTGQRAKAGRRKVSTAADGANWHKNGLILAMALWIFSVIFCKTIVEYQYNVLVAQRLSQVQMVGLTGYLYASAGVLSSILNAFGTQFLLRYAGLGIVLVMSPAAELAAALGIAAFPGVASAFTGRMLDLTMRWSLNNSAKSLLWIATPRAEQELAKPWIEGTVKKATASVTAVAIGTTLALTGGSTAAIALLSALVAAAACGACFHMHRLYSANMWGQILKREMHLADLDTAQWAEWGTEGVSGGDGVGSHGASVAQLNDNVAASIVQKLIYGPPHVQLYVLRQLGEVLPPSAWKELLDAWENLSPPVQVRVLRLCAEDSDKFPDEWLLSLLTEELHQVPEERGESADAVLAHAILACAERRLTAARPALTLFMESSSSRVRAAAAATLIRLGWGIGLGSVSEVAQAILEQTLGVPLGLGPSSAASLVPPSFGRTPSTLGPSVTRSLMPLQPTSPRGLGGRLQSMADGTYTGPDDSVPGSPTDPATINARIADLNSRVTWLHSEWERLVDAGEDGMAMAKALQLTRVKASLAAAERVAAHAAVRISGASSVDEEEGSRHSSVDHGSAAASQSILAVDGESLGVAEPNKRAYERAAVVSRLPASVRDAIHGIEMLRKLPDDIIIAMLPGSSLLQLLRHRSRHVRDAALPLVRRNLGGESSEVREGLVRAAVLCLQLPETRHHALKALRYLVSKNDVEVGELAVRLARSDLMATLSLASEPEHEATDGEKPDGGDGGHKGANPAPSAAVSGLLDFMHDASLLHESPRATEAYASDLLSAATRVRNYECVQELLDALLRLKASGRGCPTRLLEFSVRQEALELLKGLSILRWVSTLELADIPAPPSPLRAWLLGVVEMRDTAARPSTAPSLRELLSALAVLKGLASQHLEERLYQKRLRLVKLAMLCAKTGGKLPTSARVAGGSDSTTKAPSLGGVLAAWKMMRSDNPKAQAAALEVVEMVLGSGPLASVVMPLIDSSPMEKQLQIGESTFTELRLIHAHAPPPWIRAWLAADGDRLSRALGDICAELGGGAFLRLAREGHESERRFSGDASKSMARMPSKHSAENLAAATAGRQAGSHPQCPSSTSLGELPSVSAILQPVTGPSSAAEPVTNDGIIARTVLLRGVPLFANLLTLHVSNLAKRTQMRRVARGEHFCRPGEAYLLVSGTVHKAGRPDRVYHHGDLLQQLGCIYDTLPPLDLVAGGGVPSLRLSGLGDEKAGRKKAVEDDSDAGASLLVITHATVWDVLTHSPPRFGLSLLRALVRLGQPATKPTDTTTSAGALDPVATAPPPAGAPAPEQIDRGELSAAARAAMREDERRREAEADAKAVQMAKEAVGDEARARERESLVAELDGEEDGEDDMEEDLASTGTSLHTTDDITMSEISGGRPANSRRGHSFSFLERALLLREVHVLRFVDTEFLPSLAAITTEQLVPRGELACEQGQPTGASLIVVAHGRLRAWRTTAAGAVPEPIGELNAGESLGNTTALLPDSLWQYSATALEDTWTLTIHARDLSDLLRGREEFAHAMLRGFFDTFNRRLRQVVEQGGSIKREWILAVDVNKSPVIRPGGSHPFAATNENEV